MFLFVFSPGGVLYTVKIIHFVVYLILTCLLLQITAKSCETMKRKCWLLCALVMLTGVAGAEVVCPAGLACGCTVSSYYDKHALILDCTDRDFHSVPETLMEAVKGIPVVTLDLSKNRIASLSDRVFKGVYFLMVYEGHDPKIILDANPLTRVSTAAFQGISGERLTVSFVNCSLGSIPKNQLSEIANLTGLDVQRNSVASIPSGLFGPFPKLEQLDLSHNPLNKLEDDVFDGLQDVLRIVIAGNIGLMTFPSSAFMDLSKLSIISLEKNRIQDLPSNMFEGYATEEEALSLNLNENFIKHIAEDALSKQGTKLKIFHLRLDGNRITTTNFLADPCSKVIRDDTFMTATMVYLNDNPLECGCDLYNISTTGMYYIFGRCATPHSYAGLEIYCTGNWGTGNLKSTFGRKANAECAVNPPGSTPWDISCKDWRKLEMNKTSVASHITLYLLLYVACILYHYGPP